MSKEKFDRKLIIVTFSLISLVVFFNFQNFDANATTATHNSATTSGPSWFGNVYVQKFTGLPVGQVITKFAVWTSVNGSGKFFSAPPVGAHTTGLSTLLWASKYSASAGSHINDIALDVFATGSGHVRVKLYTDSSGPNTLIAESGSIAVAGTGLQYFPIQADFPASGNVWAAFETDTSSMDLFEGTNGNIQAASHTYGSGPSTFGGFLCPTCTQPYIGINYTISSSALRIKAYQDDGSSGNPSTLLGETSPLGISTGKQNFTISTPVIIPASGNVWVGFETNTTSWGPFHGAVITAEQIIAHTFGTGPSPFGSGICGSCTDEIWSQITYVNANATVQFRPMLHDNSTILTSGRVFAIQNGVTIASATTNSTGWANLGLISQGNYNFTFFDDKNFEVYKLINYNINGNIAKNIATYDTPFNCVTVYPGYQSDFILRINDTDGTHITNITTPTCPYPYVTLKFNMTFTGNGQSGNTFSSSMLTSISTETYKANAKNFTVSGTLVPTTFTGTNLISNSFSIGSGLATTTKNFVISLGTTQVPTPGTGGGSSPNLNPNPIPNNPCGINYVFDNISQQCVIINPGNLPPPSTVCDDNHVRQGFQDINGVCTAPPNVINVPIDCGGPNITIVTVVVPPNAGFEPILTPPFTYQCPDDTTTIPIVVPPNNCALGEALQPDGTCQIPPPPNTCPSDLLSCLVVTPPTNKLELTAEKADGSTVSLSVPIPNLGSPQLTSLAWLIIFVILFAVIGGYIYRKYFSKQRKKRKRSNGSSDTIQKFNKDLNKKYR